MSDWSSFNDDKTTFDAWREFLIEEEVTAVEDEELLREIDWRMVGKAAMKIGGEVLKQLLPALLTVVIKWVPEAVQSARDFMYGGYWTGHVQAGFATLSPARRAALARELEDSYETASLAVRAAEEEASAEVSETDDELPTDIFGSLPGLDSLLTIVDRTASSFGRSDSESTTTSEAKVKKKKEQSLLDQRVAIEKQINAETKKIATQLLAKASAAANAGTISKEELIKYQKVIARRVKAMKAAAYQRATGHVLKATAEKRTASLGAALSTTRSDSEGEKKRDSTELEPSDYEVDPAGKLSDIDPSQYDAPEDRGTVHSAPEKVKMAEKPTNFQGDVVGYGNIQHEFEEMFPKGNFSEAMQAWADLMGPIFPDRYESDLAGVKDDYEQYKDTVQKALLKKGRDTMLARKFFYAIGKAYTDFNVRINGKRWRELSPAERAKNITRFISPEIMAIMIRNIVASEDEEPEELNEQKILNHWKLLAGIK